MKEVKITQLMFAGDLAIVVDSEENIQFNINIINEELQKMNGQHKYK